MLDNGAPEIYAIIGYPIADGRVVLSRQKVVTLEEAEQYHRLGWIVLIDPESEAAYFQWQRWQMGQWGGY